MKTDDIEISKALPSEWEEAMELAFKTFLKYEAPEYGKEGTDSFLNFISDEKLYKMFLNGEYVTLVAKKDGKIVGVASVRTKNHISLLFVDEAYHKQGIGRMLLHKLQSGVYELTRSFYMTVNASPYGIGFYERVGFTKTDGMCQADGISYQPMAIDTGIML